MAALAMTSTICGGPCDFVIPAKQGASDAAQTPRIHALTSVKK